MTAQAITSLLNTSALAPLVIALFAGSLKGSVLLAGAWAITRTMRRASAAARHLVWASALGGMLVMPVLNTTLPRLHLASLPVVELPSALVVSGALETPRNDPSGTSFSADGSTRPTSPAPQQNTREAQRSTSALAAGPTSIPLARYLPLLWALGAALILLRLALGTMRVSSWSRRARPVDDGTWLALVQRIAVRMGLARPVILLRSERACVPMTWGVVYPTVLLPIDADEWPEERRTLVLLHELAHVKRLDAFTQLVAQLTAGLFWFNPLVWLAIRQMRTEREHACDDVVLRGGARPSDYAADLLQIARSLGGSSAPATAALAMARRNEFEGRLLAILDPYTNRHSVSGARLALAAGTVMIVSLPLAALAPADPAPIGISAAPSAPSTSVLMPKRANEPAEVATTAAPLVVPGVTEPASAAMPSATPTQQLAASAPAIHHAPDVETLRDVARAAARLTSDNEKAELLLTIMKYYVPDDTLQALYVAAVATMTSDYEKSRTLMPLLEKDSLSMSAVVRMGGIVESMTADNEKAGLIIKLATDRRPLHEDVLSVLINATTWFTSDHDRARSIVALARNAPLASGQLIALIRSTGRMSGSYDKANTLIELSTRGSLADPDVRKEFLKAAETITGASDYRRAMVAVLK